MHFYRIEIFNVFPRRRSAYLPTSALFQSFVEVSNIAAISTTTYTADLYNNYDQDNILIFNGWQNERL